MRRAETENDLARRNVRRAMVRAGLSTKQLAARLMPSASDDQARRRMARLLNGRTQLTLHDLAELGRILNVAPAELAFGEVPLVLHAREAS